MFQEALLMVPGEGQAQGKRIRELRTKAGLSQQDLAEKLGVTRGAVSAWEVGRNEPDLSTIVRMCEIFGCKLEDIVPRVPSRPGVDTIAAFSMPGHENDPLPPGAEEELQTILEYLRHKYRKQTNQEGGGNTPKSK